MQFGCLQTYQFLLNHLGQCLNFVSPLNQTLVVDWLEMKLNNVSENVIVFLSQSPLQK